MSWAYRQGGVLLTSENSIRTPTNVLPVWKEVFWQRHKLNSGTEYKGKATNGVVGQYLQYWDQGQHHPQKLLHTRLVGKRQCHSFQLHSPQCRGGRICEPLSPYVQSHIPWIEHHLKHEEEETRTPPNLTMEPDEQVFCTQYPKHMQIDQGMKIWNAPKC